MKTETQNDSKHPFGLKKFRVFENQTHWNTTIFAKSAEQAKAKAWTQFWSKLPYTHFTKSALETREL